MKVLPAIHFPIARTALATLALVCTAVLGDSMQSHCEIYPRGEDHTDVEGPCMFSQRQGNVTIRRSDGVVHELRPTGEAPGNFLDQHGRDVYRQSGLGQAGLIFRFPGESVYVYWGSRSDSEASATAPYSSADYDATTLLRCRDDSGGDEQQCPAGILRMDGGASIVLRAPGGAEFTINFLPGYVNTTFGPSQAQRDGDLWTVIVPGAGIFEVPLAAIEGG